MVSTYKEILHSTIHAHDDTKAVLNEGRYENTKKREIYIYRERGRRTVTKVFDIRPRTDDLTQNTFKT